MKTEITQKHLESLILEANANQNKSLENFLYYKERKLVVYDVIARTKAFMLDSLFKDMSRNLRDQIMFEVQAMLVFRNRSARCPHKWVEFKNSEKRACEVCFTLEDMNGK